MTGSKWAACDAYGLLVCIFVCVSRGHVLCRRVAGAWLLSALLVLSLPNTASLSLVSRHLCAHV
jgi:hypothetical protein